MTAPASSAVEHSSGLPQFDLGQWPGEIVWALAIFAILYVLFRYVFVPRIGGAIDAREDKISGDIGDARRLRDEAQAQSEAAAAELDEARGRAHRLAAEARAAAKADAVSRQAKEDEKLAMLLAAAESRIGEARAEAMSHVGGIASEAAQAMVARLTGQPASAAEMHAALGSAPSHG
ncbi:MAG TPA: hypothetical protein VIC25_11300 [Caulobacteraceae bacterium]|jgi:F-type H+-transporting ATPase subunit b